VRNKGNAESILFDIDERQAHAVYGNRSFAGHLGELSGRGAELHGTPIGIVVPGVDSTDGVDMAGDVMATDAVAGPQRLFEVYRGSGQKFSEVCSRERFLTRLKRQLIAVDLDDGQAAAVDRDAVADFRCGSDRRVTNDESNAWRLGSDVGRRYAAVSGDHNPIHLYRLTARALGFPRQIAHGMWSLARCVAALENRLPDAVTVDAAFKKPILLPGTVAFGQDPVESGISFALTSPRNGAPHVVGRTRSVS